MKHHLLEPSPGEVLPAQRLSDDLRTLLVRADGRSLTLGELEQILQGRGSPGAGSSR